MQGLYLLWWVQSRHISAALVGAILAAGDFTLLLVEVPTGWFADRFGHRRSLIVGSTAQVLGMLACWLGRNVTDLIAACVLVAVGDAFRSGADQALLYRTCVALGREGDFQRVESRTQAARLAGLVALVLAGGAIVTRWGFNAGWAAETALCAAGVAIACAMREPPRADAAATNDGDAKPRAARRMGVRTIISLLAPAALLGAAASGASFLAQTAGDSEPARNTLLVAFITLAEAAGAALAMRASAAGARAQARLVVLALLTIGVASAFPATLVAVVIALSFLAGIAYPLRAAAIQRAVPDEVRARAVSAASACDMAIKMIALPLAGAYRVRRSSRR